jgi:hypothetical protein
MRAVNVPMRYVLQLPFETPISRRLMLLHLVGRRSGRIYRQPVSYVTDEDTLLTPGGGNWKRNLRNGEPVRIRIKGRDIFARPQQIAEPSEVERLLGVMTAANPMLKRFVPIPRTPDGRFEAGSLTQAIEHGFRVVRWEPSSSKKAERPDAAPTSEG